MHFGPVPDPVAHDEGSALLPLRGMIFAVPAAALIWVALAGIGMMLLHG